MEQRQGDRSAGRRDDVEGSSRAYPFRQRPGVRGQRPAEMAGRYRREDALHRARQSMGKRLLRELQLKAPGRVPEWRDLLLAQGGAGARRTVARSLQHDPSTLFAGLPVTSTGNVAART